MLAGQITWQSGKSGMQLNQHPGETTSPFPQNFPGVGLIKDYLILFAGISLSLSNLLSPFNPNQQPDSAIPQPPRTYT